MQYFFYITISKEITRFSRKHLKNPIEQNPTKKFSNPLKAKPKSKTAPTHPTDNTDTQKAHRNPLERNEHYTATKRRLVLLWGRTKTTYTPFCTYSPASTETVSTGPFVSPGQQDEKGWVQGNDSGRRTLSSEERGRHRWAPCWGKGLSSLDGLGVSGGSGLEFELVSGNCGRWKFGSFWLIVEGNRKWFWLVWIVFFFVIVWCLVLDEGFFWVFMCFEGFCLIQFFLECIGYFFKISDIHFLLLTAWVTHYHFSLFI